jgi:hypothetical protein
LTVPSSVTNCPQSQSRPLKSVISGFIFARYNTYRGIYGNTDFLGAVEFTKPFKGKQRFSHREKVNILIRFVDDQNSALASRMVVHGEGHTRQLGTVQRSSNSLGARTCDDSVFERNLART